jgi:hypothetical protein
MVPSLENGSVIGDCLFLGVCVGAHFYSRFGEVFAHPTESAEESREVCRKAKRGECLFLRLPHRCAQNGRNPTNALDIANAIANSRRAYLKVCSDDQ